MNDLNANNVSQMAKAVSSAPQVLKPKQDAKVDAKAEVAVTSGKELPAEKPVTDAHARSVEVKEAVSKLNAYAQKTQRDLDFHLDEDSGKTVIRVYDRSSEKLVRQIPDEAALEMAKKLNSEEPALLFSAQV